MRSTLDCASRARSSSAALARLLAIARGVELAEHLDALGGRPAAGVGAASGSARCHSSREDLGAVELADRQPDRLQLGAQRVDVRLALARRAPMLADAALQRRRRAAGAARRARRAGAAGSGITA